jgi:methylated-DNA-[protein]-cysteine S-methyltransferase
MDALHTTTVDTPFGAIGLAAHGDALVGVSLGGPFADSPAAGRLARATGAARLVAHPDPAGAATRLRRYVAGELHALDEQPVALHGTAFQNAVWRALRDIAPGSTVSYRELAERIGRPTAVRAVGAANGANWVALFVPCHRVIAADGTLWGYGGGLPMKAWLLRHEGAVSPAGQAELPLA